MRKQVGRFVVGLAVMALVACSGGGSSPTSPGTTGGNNTGGNNTGSAPLTANVSMYQTSFTPGNVTIKVGGSVTWKNDDGIDHTATGGGFDTGTVTGGQQRSQSFATAGTYNYHCSFHSNMTGTVNVVN